MGCLQNSSGRWEQYSSVEDDDLTSARERKRIGVFIMLRKVRIPITELICDYRIELVHPTLDRSIIGGGTAAFEEGDSWGHNNFCDMEDEIRDYCTRITPLGDPCLTFRFTIRPANLYQHCKLQQAYINYLTMV